MCVLVCWRPFLFILVDYFFYVCSTRFLSFLLEHGFIQPHSLKATCSQIIALVRLLGMLVRFLTCSFLARANTRPPHMHPSFYLCATIILC